MNLYLDACAIIYAIEGAPTVRAEVRNQIAQGVSAAGRVLTSRLSLIECRVRPMRLNASALLQAYNEFFASEEVEIVEIDANIVERATNVRAEMNFRVPDALHISSAIEKKADAFLTGDKDLARCSALNVRLLQVS